jgi:hypothetical protein
MSATEIASRLGVLRFRPEGEDDRAFRFRLFCDSRPDEWEQLHLDVTIREQLMRLQFEAQTASYRTGSPPMPVSTLSSSRTNRSDGS